MFEVQAHLVTSETQALLLLASPSKPIRELCEPFKALTDVALSVHPRFLHMHSILGPGPPVTGCPQSTGPHPPGGQDLSIHPLWAPFLGTGPSCPST